MLSSINQQPSKIVRRRLPLKLTDKEQLNVYFVLNVLHFGSSWEPILNQVGTTWEDCRIGGVLGMCLTKQLTAQFLSDLQLHQVAEYFRLPLDQDVQHPQLPVTISQAHPIRPYIEQIHMMLQRVGRALLHRGFPDFASWFSKVESKQQLVDRLVKMMPFVYCDNIDSISLNKKAWLLVETLNDLGYSLQGESEFVLDLSETCLANLLQRNNRLEMWQELEKLYCQSGKSLKEFEGALSMLFKEKPTLLLERSLLY